MKQYLNMKETLFRDREVFEIDFDPEIFRFRETQISDIVSAIQPGPHGNYPHNLVLQGPPGTGKTTAVRRIFSEIRATGQRFIPIYINCYAGRSKFDIFSRIYTELHDQTPPLKAQTTHQLIEKIGRRVSEREEVLLVCFDNADTLLPGYLLEIIICPILSHFEEYPKARVVFLLTMSTMKVDRRQALDPCIISVLRPDKVHFPQYKKKQVREIIQDRVQAGLHPGVISDEVFSFLIRHITKGGNVQAGIDLVKWSVMSAERDGRSSVTEEDIMGSFEVSGYSGTARVECEG